MYAAPPFHGWGNEGQKGLHLSLSLSCLAQPTRSDAHWIPGRRAWSKLRMIFIPKSLWDIGYPGQPWLGLTSWTELQGWWGISPTLGKGWLARSQHLVGSELTKQEYTAIQGRVCTSHDWNLRPDGSTKGQHGLDQAVLWMPSQVAWFVSTGDESHTGT